MYFDPWILGLGPDIEDLKYNTKGTTTKCRHSNRFGMLVPKCMSIQSTNHKSKVAERSMISAEPCPGDLEKIEDQEMEIADARMIETAAAPWFVSTYSCVAFPAFKSTSAFQWI